MTAGKGTYRDVPPESFEERNKSWDELSYSTQYYHYNRSDGHQVKYNKRVRKRNSKFVELVKDNKECSVCGENYPACLVFHHLSDKEYEIGVMVSNGHSLKSISNEMNKCTILCANCHRKHHDGLINGSSFTTLSIEPDNYTEEI